MNGGSLYLPEWQERYDKLSEQLEKADAHELEKAKRDVGFVDSDEEGDAEAEGEEAVKEEPKDAEDGGETQESGDQDVEMAEGEDGEPAPKKPKSKKKPPRESQLDMAAIQAEQTALDPNLVMALRMNKKYHADALRFINAIEDAVPVLAQLLVSTNKSEALEAIRFFRIAYEYRFVGAEVGIKTMIHLIWTKDNTSTAGTEETEGGKGIRGSLIETYKSLYFDVVPDLAPKQQVNRIARNMIERTYNATLAELTSLEELMRTMMLEGGPEGGVHEDVINKLWQVYCEPSSSRQLASNKIWLLKADCNRYRLGCAQASATGCHYHPRYARCSPQGGCHGTSRESAADRSGPARHGESDRLWQIWEGTS